MTSATPASMNSRMSAIVCARSPVAIGSRVAARTRASAAAFSGGTGSSIHSGSYGSSIAATRTAVAGVKRPCISTRICTSGPTASRTAATIASARRRSAARQLRAGGAERIELQRAIAARDDLLRRARRSRRARAPPDTSRWRRPARDRGTCRRAASRPARRATAPSDPSRRRRTRRAPTASPRPAARTRRAGRSTRAARRRTDRMPMT